MTRAQWLAGRVAVPYDIRYNSWLHDLNEDAGLIFALALAAQVRDGGGGLAATVCSTWVYMNSGTAMRSKIKPLGRTSLPQIAAANKMVSRTVLLLLVLSAVGAMWFLEQPQGSLMEFHPRVQWLLHLMPVWKKSFEMSSFGAPTPKRTWVYSNKPHINGIEDYSVPKTNGVKKQMVKKYKNAKGETKITGGKDLKGSQSYPDPFGFAILGLMVEHEESLIRDAQKLHAEAAKHAANHAIRLVAHPAQSNKLDHWVDAELEGCFALLSAGLR